ncbi:MAG TPA: CorA family divalent cation transporter [Candidatus Paceibacterota bacterium]|nr:CorA family divalent cation transporter [Candidatus Paceibacterota bacterium]
MLKRFEHNGLTWVDLESPTRDEVVKTAAEFSLEASVAEELLLPSAKPRAEFHDGHLLVVMHFPAIRHSHVSKAQEVDFVIGGTFIITAHYDPVDPLHKFSKVFEVNSVLGKSEIGEHAGHLFFSMLKKLYRSVEHELENVHSELDHIEEHIFSGEEVRMVAAISRASRDLMNLRQTIEPHRDLLEEIQESGPQFFGQDFAPYLKRLTNEYYRVHSHIMRSIESARELRKTNDSLLTTKQNETMKVLTMMSFFTFPLALLVAILGLDVVGNPVRTLHDAFWVIAAIVVGVAGFMFWFFKRQNWL